MNHNFANWELTQLLPELRSNNQYRTYWLKELFSDSEPFLVTINQKQEGIFDVWEEKNFEALEVYTWEDIRLYLERKGFYLNMYTFLSGVTSALLCGMEIRQIKDNIETFEIPKLFKTYEEAREAGIRYCLNLIKTDGTDGNNKI